MSNYKHGRYPLRRSPLGGGRGSAYATWGLWL